MTIELANDQQQTSGERVYPLYPVMIRNLFKRFGDLSQDVLHASVGLVGEAIEWNNAGSRKHFIEEGGDYEFYLEALKQCFTAKLPKAPLPPHALAQDIELGNVHGRLTLLSGDLLDLAKKSWVYGKPYDTEKATLLVILVEINLNALYSFYGVTRGDVQHANMVKLIGPGGRFESGFYSDAAAIARVDKVGEGRTFMSDKS